MKPSPTLIPRLLPIMRQPPASFYQHSYSYTNPHFPLSLERVASSSSRPHSVSLTVSNTMAMEAAGLGSGSSSSSSSGLRANEWSKRQSNTFDITSEITKSKSHFYPKPGPGPVSLPVHNPIPTSNLIKPNMTSSQKDNKSDTSFGRSAKSVPAATIAWNDHLSMV
ncbi:uncharacterized protein IL334_005233 [Kwoniella shivajii]|uniref:Uncharacterized protein n=1 Tax=Kwoniella shivajii TaxID=564305 RepID=A0ABZ1D2K7_9TREE|nr:hypothetical protein IL334_005233 [Kwoniella shivajii]